MLRLGFEPRTLWSTVQLCIHEFTVTFTFYTTEGINKSFYFIFLPDKYGILKRTPQFLKCDLLYVLGEGCQHNAMFFVLFQVTWIIERFTLCSIHILFIKVIILQGPLSPLTMAHRGFSHLEGADGIRVGAQESIDRLMQWCETMRPSNEGVGEVVSYSFYIPTLLLPYLL